MLAVRVTLTAHLKQCSLTSSRCELLSHVVPPLNITCTRNVSFITSLTAEQLWGGVSGVSNAGRKRGRAKGRLRRPSQDSKGKYLGEGYGDNKWPGLNAPIAVGNRVVTIPKSTSEYHYKRISPGSVESTNEGDKPTTTDAGPVKEHRRRSVPALQRGWSGSKWPGMSVGPPDPVGDYTFEGFDSRVLEFKIVSNMTGNLGRKNRFSAMVITGNKNGLAGFAFSKSTNGAAAIRKAKNRAAQKLQYFERFENHTVFHDFYTKENKTGIFVYKQHKGHGLICHRAIKTICDVIGIENLYAKVEGSTGNVLAIIRAFFQGLREQETHQKLADRLRLHVVEIRKEQDYMPIVVASPAPGMVRETTEVDEDLEFDRLYYGGRLPLARKKKRPFFYNFRSHKKKLDGLYKLRNQPQTQVERIVYGMAPSKDCWQKGGLVE